MKQLKGLIFTVLLLQMTMFSIVHAQTTKAVEHHISMFGVTDVRISVAVGSVYITETEGDEAGLRVEFEGRRQGLFRRAKHVSDMDIELQVRNDTLHIAFEEEKVTAKVFLSLPADRVLDIEIGVGALDTKIGTAELKASVGVGEVIIRQPESEIGPITAKTGVGDILIYAPHKTTGHISIAAGVGATRIEGATEYQASRTLVSSVASGRGQGVNAIHADVGIGEVGVILE